MVADFHEVHVRQAGTDHDASQPVWGPSKTSVVRCPPETIGGVKGRSEWKVLSNIGKRSLLAGRSVATAGHRDWPHC
jgi:hypothetical protein